MKIDLMYIALIFSIGIIFGTYMSQDNIANRCKVIGESSLSLVDKKIKCELIKVETYGYE